VQLHLQRHARQLRVLSVDPAPADPGVADVSPDYKTEASALLMEQPIDYDMTGTDDTLADYFRDYL
jgi:hypothetical protein